MHRVYHRIDDPATLFVLFKTVTHYQSSENLSFRIAKDRVGGGSENLRIRLIQLLATNRAEVTEFPAVQNAGQSAVAPLDRCVCE